MSEISSCYLEDIYSIKDFCSLDNREKKMIWEWRNHLSVRQWMYNKNFIDLKTHLKFIENLNNSNTKKYWLVKRRNLDVGAFYLVNIQESQGELGYYIAPEFHEMNLSVEFYYYSLNHLFENVKVIKLYGFALLQNKAANSLNDLFGFSKQLIDKEINGVIEKYYFRELTSDIWFNKTKSDKRIERLLQFTQNKS